MAINAEHSRCSNSLPTPFFHFNTQYVLFKALVSVPSMSDLVDLKFSLVQFSMDDLARRKILHSMLPTGPWVSAPYHYIHHMCMGEMIVFLSETFLQLFCKTIN